MAYAIQWVPLPAPSGVVLKMPTMRVVWGVRVHNGLAVSFVKSKTGDGEDRSRVVVVFIEVACRDRGELF